MVWQRLVSFSFPQSVETNSEFALEHGSPEFNEFVESLGERITLQGWKGYRGGLDCKGAFFTS